MSVKEHSPYLTVVLDIEFNPLGDHVVKFRGLNMMHTVVVELQMNIAIFPSGPKQI